MDDRLTTKEKLVLNLIIQSERQNIQKRCFTGLKNYYK